MLQRVQRQERMTNSGHSFRGQQCWRNTMWDRYRVKSPVKGSNQVDLSRDHSVRKTAMWIVWKRAPTEEKERNSKGPETTQYSWLRRNSHETGEERKEESGRRWNQTSSQREELAGLVDHGENTDSSYEWDGKPLEDSELTKLRSNSEWQDLS